MENVTKDLIETAAAFVNSTSSHIFLTGKAGTGKTTFLKNLAQRTHKRFVIVAPTGIAALNAGGVTIHSQFQLPLGTFLPDRTPSGHFSDQSNVYTQYTLSRKHPISGLRRQVLRAIDLLIIDEVSMLRADVLDAIDYRLRVIRGDHQRSFGGVQVLMIGDLFQLPPIVKDHEWNYLKRYYHSVHFFEAKALQSDGFVYIELDKIFRQSDQKFITILNHLRNNALTKEDVEELNSHFHAEASPEDEIITLTTHNFKADEINKSALGRLSGNSTFYQALVEDDFPPHIFPLPESLELKVGAQVMFVKNDTSGNNKYFNGKLARVIEADPEDVVVEMANSHEKFKLEKVKWENKKYTINGTTKELDEEIIGSFSHFPVKLAWAVTVHKSQGLTFDRAIVDVGSAFAPGQVYVALSRLRSLDGLLLKTRIDPSVISSDQLVVTFSKSKNSQDDLAKILPERQRLFIRGIISSAFDFALIVKESEKFIRDNEHSDEFEDESMRSAISLISVALRNQELNTGKFRAQLLGLLAEDSIDQMLERLSKGSEYYSELLKNNIKSLLLHAEQVRKYARQKTYLNGISDLDHLMMTKLNEVEKAYMLIQSIFSDGEMPDAQTLNKDREQDRNKWLADARNLTDQQPISARNKSGKVRKAKAGNTVKKNKGDSVLMTVKLYREGLTVAQIAEQRSLVTGTVEEHLAKAVGLGELKFDEFVKLDELDAIKKGIDECPGESLKELFDFLKGQYTYTKLRIVKTHTQGVQISQDIDTKVE